MSCGFLAEPEPVARGPPELSSPGVRISGRYRLGGAPTAEAPPSLGDRDWVAVRLHLQALSSTRRAVCGWLSARSGSWNRRSPISSDNGQSGRTASFVATEGWRKGGRPASVAQRSCRCRWTAPVSMLPLGRGGRGLPETRSRRGRPPDQPSSLDETGQPQTQRRLTPPEASTRTWARHSASSTSNDRASAAVDAM